MTGKENYDVHIVQLSNSHFLIADENTTKSGKINGTAL